MNNKKPCDICAANNKPNCGNDWCHTRSKMRRSKSLTAAEKIKSSGNKLLTRIARFAALLRFQHITQKKYKKKTLKAKYERS